MTHKIDIRQEIEKLKQAVTTLSEIAQKLETPIEEEKIEYKPGMLFECGNMAWVLCCVGKGGYNLVSLRPISNRYFANNHTQRDISSAIDEYLSEISLERAIELMRKSYGENQK